VRLPLVTVLLAALNALLAWAIAVQLLGEPRLGEQVRIAAAAAKAPAVPEAPAALAPLSFDGLQSQAVFHKSRSFYVAPPPMVQQPTPDYRMVGLMALPNRPPSAVLLNNQSNARIKVAVGDQLEGWNVAEVTARKVVIQLGDRTAEINSASRGGSGGRVVVPGSQASTAASPGMVRVLGAPAAPAQASAPAQPRPNSPADSAPRLYRPPSQ
jgi:hypothetical protein